MSITSLIAHINIEQNILDINILFKLIKEEFFNVSEQSFTKAPARDTINMTRKSLQRYSNKAINAFDNSIVIFPLQYLFFIKNI